MLAENACTNSIEDLGADAQRTKKSAASSPCQWASQAIHLGNRAYGKAPTLNTSDPTVMKRAIDMTDDELAAIASRATLHVASSPA